VSLVSPSVFIVATLVAAIFRGVGIAAAFVSAIVGYQLTEAALRDSNVKIAEANARTKEAELKLEQLRKLSGPRDIKVFAKRLKESQRRMSKYGICQILRMAGGLHPDYRSLLALRVGKSKGQSQYPNPTKITYW
jgi:hypothetical protein